MTETITLGGGCFWCIEAVLQDLRGVESVVSGYSGGSVANPTYEQVCGERTGHVEVVQVVFKPEEISLHDLLTIFFTLHDPTQLNRQGNDIGRRYRSVIFYHTPEQEAMANAVIKEMVHKEVWPGKIVTTLEPFEAFYPAGEDHQRYYERNMDQAYCQVIIAPKVRKLRKFYSDKLRDQ
ncbi:MAG TPA: peptide-methionine (S)-S-oxide reductase MsrA [Verrucomicrobiae bacterium]|nr:peptide-methionine (S)-S-oxide reductase MsrA [Verrucomicrobiae bacterium]